MPALPKRFCFKKQDVHSLLMVSNLLYIYNLFRVEKYEKVLPKRMARSLCFVIFVFFRKGVAVLCRDTLRPQRGVPLYTAVTHKQIQPSPLQMSLSCSNDKSSIVYYRTLSFFGICLKKRFLFRLLKFKINFDLFVSLSILGRTTYSVRFALCAKF